MSPPPRFDVTTLPTPAAVAAERKAGVMGEVESVPFETTRDESGTTPGFGITILPERLERPETARAASYRLLARP